MTFPLGPFFNFRTAEELTLIERIQFRFFGKKKIAEAEGYRVTAYYYNGITYIHKLERV